MTVESRVGRLLEIRWTDPAVHRVDAFEEELSEIAARLPATWITVVDLRGARLASDPEAQRIIAIMRKWNGRVERAAYLLGDQSLFGIQLEAMVLRAYNPERKVFRERRALERWLGERCTSAEAERLKTFLDTL